MMSLTRCWALLTVAYLAMAETIAIGWTSRLALDAPLLASSALVPLVQAIALTRVVAASRGFFAMWAVLFTVVAVIGVPVRAALDGGVILDAVLAHLLFVPAVQAGALRWSDTGARFVGAVRRIVRLPLARPVIVLDVALIAAGVVWLTHPLVGLGYAGLLQRHWAATKFLLAAVLLAIAASRVARQSAPAIASCAAVLVVVAVEGFLPWMLHAAEAAPWPLNRQPLALTRLLTYATVAALAITLLRRSGRGLPPAAGTVVRGAAVMVFSTLLMLIQHGFLSVQPVAPWAALAMVAATGAATLCLLGAVGADSGV